MNNFKGWKHISLTPSRMSYYSNFQGCACLNLSHFKLLKYFQNIFTYYFRMWPRKNIRKILFNFIYYVGVWSIFVKMNVVYLCIQKHKYIPKIIYMIFYFYESWRYIEPCHVKKFEPCLNTLMWLIFENFHFKTWVFPTRMYVNVW
jgi:hypothetical protein